MSEGAADDGMGASQKAVSDAYTALHNRLGGLEFAQDAEGNWGYKPAGADTVTPFKKGGGTIKVVYLGLFNITSASYLSQQNEYYAYKINDTWSNFVGKYIIIACVTTSGASQQSPGIIYNGIYEGKPFQVSVYGNNTGSPSRVTIYEVVVEN